MHNTRYNKILLFDTFLDALKNLIVKDSIVCSWPRNRVPVSHVLATRIGANPLIVREQFFADLQAPFPPQLKLNSPDILVHDRKESRIMAILCRDSYLQEKEQTQLLEMSRVGTCDLVLALSLLPQKDYMLIYLAEGNHIDYYHLFQDTLECVLLKQREFPSPDDTQLPLIKQRKKSN